MASLSIPYAILPCIKERGSGVDDEDNTITVDRCILSVFENKCYEWKNMFKDYAGAWCIGSSHGWLILLDTKGCPFLLTPSSSTCISLPSFSHSFMHRASVNHSYYVESLLKSFVSKAVLVRSTSLSQYTLAIMYSCPCKLAFCTKPSTWCETCVELPDAKSIYYDIVSHNNHLYALAQDGSLQGWNFHSQIPFKVIDVSPTRDDVDEEEEREFPRDKFS